MSLRPPRATRRRWESARSGISPRRSCAAGPIQVRRGRLARWAPVTGGSLSRLSRRLLAAVAAVTLGVVALVIVLLECFARAGTGDTTRRLHPESQLDREHSLPGCERLRVATVPTRAGRRRRASPATAAPVRARPASPAGVGARCTGRGLWPGCIGRGGRHPHKRAYRSNGSIGRGIGLRDYAQRKRAGSGSGRARAELEHTFDPSEPMRSGRAWLLRLSSTNGAPAGGTRRRTFVRACGLLVPSAAGGRDDDGRRAGVRRRLDGRQLCQSEPVGGAERRLVELRRRRRVRVE